MSVAIASYDRNAQREMRPLVRAPSNDQINRAEVFGGVILGGEAEREAPAQAELRPNSAGPIPASGLP
jgi:hypothetical protein